MIDYIGEEINKLPKPPDGFHWEVLKITWSVEPEDWMCNDVTANIDFILKPNQ